MIKWLIVKIRILERYILDFDLSPDPEKKILEYLKKNRVVRAILPSFTELEFALISSILFL